MAITVLIHSSKTMRVLPPAAPATMPVLMDKTTSLAVYLQSLTSRQLQSTMHISEALANKTYATLAAWNAKPADQSLAVDSFVGDIYSGLQATTLSKHERDYAQQSLRILSGLYGVLRPYDGVRPYRLEMGYRLPGSKFANLYTYWGKAIVETLPRDSLIINASAVEYTKTIIPYVDAARVITPRFLTINASTGQPGQVIVHTKIARGAFARWLMVSRVTAAEDMQQFNDLNYRYDAALSTRLEPVFVCQDFGGIGLSMRLQT